METKDAWTILAWHGVDVLHELGVLNCIRNLIDEISDQVVEAIAWLEDLLLYPHLTKCVKEFSVKTICNSSTILHFADHVDHSFP